MTIITDVNIRCDSCKVKRATTMDDINGRAYVLLPSGWSEVRERNGDVLAHHCSANACKAKTSFAAVYGSKDTRYGV